jgi:hypothetical protein
VFYLPVQLVISVTNTGLLSDDGSWLIGAAILSMMFTAELFCWSFVRVTLYVTAWNNIKGFRVLGCLELLLEYGYRFLVGK